MMNQTACPDSYHTENRGFTLIELLIVVAIIAILAAIAVPNFLEAQTRAKVSRVHADQQAIATALESYYVDWNTYTPDGNNKYFPRGWILLTTPIAYITTFFADPFHDTKGNVYDIGTGNPNDASFLTQQYPFNVWVITAKGPDNDDSTVNTISYPQTNRACPYDPTNGSVSMGDIYRFGGEFQPPVNFLAAENPILYFSENP